MADWFVDGTWRLTTRMGEDLLFQRASAIEPSENARRIPLPGRVLRSELAWGLLGRDPWVRARLLEIWRAVEGHDAFWGYAPTERELHTVVLPALVDALEQGTLVVFRQDRPRPLPVPGLEPPDEQPEPAAVDELTWIGVQVLDEEGKPVEGVRYELDLTDGSVRQGRTDREGIVRAEGIPAGQCKLRLPDFENELIPGTPPPDESAPEEEPASPAEDEPLGEDEVPPTVGDEAPETPTVLEAQVQDGNGKAMANRAFRAVFADGSTRDGKTDASGRVRLEGCPPGECKLTFSADEPSKG